MNTAEFKKGDILLGSKRGRDEAFHPILYLQESSASHFIGAMITHSTDKDNVPLHEKYFEAQGDNGNVFKIKGTESLIVNNLLLKKQEWGPFELGGRLTSEGLEFVIKLLADQNPLTWENYLDSKSH